MNIIEMHNRFRTLGQQMGMQLIRAILPESIDVFLNEVINEKVRSLVITNTATQFGDRVAIQDNSISPINAIRTLYKSSPIAVTLPIVDNEYYDIPLEIQKVMYYTSFSVKYPNIKRVGTRFIEGDKLDDTRRDYCNKESWDAPIVTMLYGNDNKEHVNLYIDSVSKVPAFLAVNYIELPATVKYDNNVNNQVSCNLPEYIHPEIVELAVDKFFKSVGYTTKQVARN